MMRPDNWRELVVAEARTWVGTPYHHCAFVKGHGVDCAMILREIYCGLHLVPWFDPRPYSPQWYLHKTEEKYLQWIEKYCHKVEVAQPADIAMYRFGRATAHGAIIVDETSMIHAYELDGQVSITERRQPLKRGTFDSYWSLT